MLMCYNNSMYTSLKQSLNTWNDTTTDREKLQHLYIAIALSLIVVAGVLGLLNQGLGQQVLAVAIAAAGIFLINSISWALLQSFVLFRLREEPVPRLKAEVQSATVKKTRTKSTRTK